MDRSFSIFPTINTIIRKTGIPHLY